MMIVNSFQKEADGQLIALQPQAHDEPLADGRKIGMVAERLPLVNIGDMHFDDGRANGGNSVGNGNGGMGIGARVENDAIVRKAHFVQLIDDLTLGVALKVMQDDMRIILLQLEEILLKALSSIDVWFPLTEQIQVGPVDDDDLHGDSGWRLAVGGWKG